ncbi:MAG: hypothetical protein AAF682_20725 [Planctomycetota bacterium]
MTHFPPMPQERFFRHANVVKVVDGDTVDVEIDVGWSTTLAERLRLDSVNTPETRGREREAGRWVTEQVLAQLPVGTPVVIASTAFDRTGRVRGKFGRTIAIVYRASDGWCLNEWLLAEKLAWQTDHNGSLVGERSLAALDGLPADLRLRNAG